MGNLFEKLMTLWKDWSDGTPKRILMLGLDAAGKTTIVYKIKLNETVSTIPTIGFNVEEVRPCKGVTFTVWDIGGQEKIRPLWQHYFLNSQGLIYVVDSNDLERISESREELFNVLADDRLRGVPVVVIANKQDLPYALSPQEVGDKMGLHELSRTRDTWVQGAVATKGDGIYEALEQMVKFSKNFTKIS